MRAEKVICVQIEDAGNDQKVTIEKRAFPDAVLWNPWSTKAKGMSDFGDEEYKVRGGAFLPFALVGEKGGWGAHFLHVAFRS